MRPALNPASKYLSAARLQPAKRLKVADHTQVAHVIAANFTKHRARKKSLASSRQASAQSLSPGRLLHKHRGLPGRPRCITPLQEALKVEKKHTSNDSEKYVEAEEAVLPKAFDGLSVKRPPSRVYRKLQPKRIEPQREIKKRRYKRKRKARKPHPDATFRIKRQVKYLLTRMNLEQNLIDAYSAEGWKGQSREKLRPERELQKAKAKILRFQLRIRDAMQELDSLSSEGTMKEFIFDSHGQIYHEDIFCAMCKSQEVVLNNDIILCDGACDRAFHQLCLRPPLRTVDIPPEGEGWLCAACDCKLECLDAVNAYLGTSYGLEDHWKDIFAEAAAFVSGDGKLLPAVREEWPSEDSEDDDYIPVQNHTRRDVDEKESSEESASSTSGDKSGSDSYSSDDVLNELAVIMENGFDIQYGNDRLKEIAAIDEDGVVVDGKRQRKEVDYTQLHEEMFGRLTAADDASEDEEWGPRKRPKKLKQAVQISDGKSKDTPAYVLQEKSFPVLQNKQSRTPLTPHALEKLRAVFKENSLPSKACKEALSKQLGLSFWKVHIWFKNVRCAALKKGLLQPAKRRRRKVTGTSEGAYKTGFDNNKEMQYKVKKKIDTEYWLASLDMLSNAQLKVDELKSRLQRNRTDEQDHGAVMYVAVGELRERAACS